MSEQPAAAVPLKILRTTAWILLIIVILSFLAQLAPVRDWILAMNARPTFARLHQLVPIIAGLVAVGAWISAVWHALADRERHLLPKPVIVLMLLFGNAIAALFYYFLFAHWTERRRAMT